MDQIKTIVQASGLLPHLSHIVDDIKRRYEEKVRVYHGLNHLIRINSYVEKYELELTQAQALGILFHDAVYIPGAKLGMNEEMSALLAQNVLLPHVDLKVVDEVWRIVIDTIAHIPTSEESKLVQDLDMLSLAEDPDTFEQDSKNVYLEVRGLVGPKTFHKKRNEFFIKLLGQAAILHSHQLSYLEPKLRANLLSAAMKDRCAWQSFPTI